MATLTRSTLPVLAGGLVAGWVAAVALPAVASDAGWTAPYPAAPLELRCRAFEVDLERHAPIDTADQTTEIGQWIAEQTNATLHTVDFELGRKNTGYPMAWAQVCVQISG